MNRRRALRSIAAVAVGAPSVLTYARAATRARVGISLPITSVQASVAADLQAGLELAFFLARERGLDLTPEWEDDKSDPELTARAVDRFGKDQSFVATTSIVGTPHAIKALPAAMRSGLPVVGLRSGAAELRDGRQGVYHLRASFNDELSRMLALAKGGTLERVAVVYSDDAFGRASAAHVNATASKLGVTITSSIPAERNGSNVQAAVTRALRAPGPPPNTLLLLMIADPMERGVRHARELLFPYPILAMSFCATRALAESRAPHLLGLGLMSAFPLPRVDVSPLSQDFRRLADAYKPGADISLTSYEGFLYGNVLARACLQASELTRTGLLDALRKPLAVGGYRIAFDAANVGLHYLQPLRKSHDGVLRA